MRIHVSSLGCKLNQSEMDSLAARLRAAGHELAASPAGADMCVLNTCAVTQVAAQKSRQAVRRLHHENPAARLVVTGCYAELSPADLQDLPGVEMVAGNRAKDHLLDHLPAPLPPATATTPAFRPRTRALVKIQDGCDNACTYCIIHVARGEQRSRPAGEILDEVRARLAAGYREIVLTGVHVGAYGRDRAGGPLELDLWGLVARILAETTVPRLRLSSVEPWDLPDGALALWQDARLCRHLHLPLQSGAAATLRRMGRRYDPAGFAALVEAARRGVEVYVIYDTFANLVVAPPFKRFPPELKVLRYPVYTAGLRFWDLRHYGRDHRKILVVDNLWYQGRTIMAVKGRIEIAGGFPELAVVHWKPNSSFFPDAAPDHYVEITDDFIHYPWQRIDDSDYRVKAQPILS